MRWIRLCIARDFPFRCGSNGRQSDCRGECLHHQQHHRHHRSHLNSNCVTQLGHGIETSHSPAIAASEPTMQPWALITPASRGIGFALTRRILQTTNCPVVATSRTNQESTKKKLLEGLDNVSSSRLTVLPLDVLGNSTHPITPKPRI